MIVELERSEVWCLPGTRVLDDPAPDVGPDIRPDRPGLARPAKEVAHEGFDEAAGEQRMSGKRAAVHRELTFERGGEDAATPASAELFERFGEPRALAAPADHRIQGDAAVAGIQDDEDVLRREASHVTQPAADAQP